LRLSSATAFLRGGSAAGSLNGRDNPRVGPAATDIAFHGTDDFSLGRLAILEQQACTGHDHSRNAVAALHRASLQKSLLEWMETAILFEPLDRSDSFAGNVGGASLARSYRLAVDQNGAGSALALAASILGSRELEIVAQNTK
jgi:hypothetical protein